MFLVLLAADAYALPTFQEVREGYKKSDAVLLDRHGKVIHELRVDPKGRRLDWMNLKDISPSFIKAVIYSEDRRFYDHHGVDWIAAGSAAVKNLFAGSRRGASTITMQLVPIIDQKLKRKNSKRDVGQKWDQMKAAVQLEKDWTKDEILEAYVNLVTFRGEIQGIDAAARGLFDKEPHGLDDSEAVLLASLVKSPNATFEVVSKRACMLSAAMNSAAQCDAVKKLARKMVAKGYTVRQSAGLAPHTARMLLKKGISSAVSTLDADVQRFAIEALTRHLGAVRSQNVNEGAVLVADNKTGDILAYVGNPGGRSGAWHVDGVSAKRQAGSTLKPFLYGLAFERRILTPASILNDSPLDVSTDLGIYKPANYENDFKGMVSARTALASSLNVPAVRVIGLTGVESFVRKLRDFGFDELEQSDYYGPSIALGAADVSLYELVNGYMALANKGMWSSLNMNLQQRENTKKRALSEEAVFLVSDILSDRGARSETFGFENPLSTRFWTAVKTGTSKDMRDNWCIGYSARYTVGVWVGNFSGRPMWDVSGVTGAAPVWIEIMNWLHKGDRGNKPPPAPGHVSMTKVEFSGDMEPSRMEFFGEGTEQEVMELGNLHESPRIVYPLNGTIIAIDPDIPDGNQIVFFEARSSAGDFRWTLNEEELGASVDSIAWEPKPGRYVLAILDAQHKVVDSIKFEVRGADRQANISEQDSLLR